MDPASEEVSGGNAARQAEEVAEGAGGAAGPAVPRWQHSAEIRQAIRESMLARVAEYVPPSTFLSSGEMHAK